MWYLIELIAVDTREPELHAARQALLLVADSESEALERAQQLASRRLEVVGAPSSFAEVLGAGAIDRVYEDPDDGSELYFSERIGLSDEAIDELLGPRGATTVPEMGAGALGTPSGWYLAELAVRFDVEGDPRSVLHLDTIFVRAANREEAEQRGRDFGGEQVDEYENPAGRTVRVRFVGLARLEPCREAPADGAWLYSWPLEVASVDDARRLVRDPTSGTGDLDTPKPNYLVKEVCAEAIAMVLRGAVQAADARALLRAAALEAKSCGFPRDDVYAFFDELLRELEQAGQGDETLDAVRDTMDLVCGWCDPSRRLFDD